MDSPQFSANEVQGIIQLACDVSSSKKPLVAAAKILATCNHLLSSSYTLLSNVCWNIGPQGRPVAFVFQSFPALRPNTITIVEKFIAQALSHNQEMAPVWSDGRLGSEVWLLNADDLARHDVAIGATALLTTLTTGSGDIRLLLSAHRAQGCPPFGQREMILMKLIRSACQHFHEWPAPVLAPRQSQVLEALERGLSEKQCALELNISRHTVHLYVKSLYRKFNVRSRAELLTLDPNQMSQKSLVSLAS